MDTNIIMWIIAIVLALIGIGAWTVKGKKVANFIPKWLAVFVGVGGAIFIIVMQMGYLATYGIPALTSVPLAVTPGVPSQITPSGICAVEDTTVTLSASNAYTSGATGGYHRYRINGAPALVIADAGTLTASPGDQLQILWYNASYSGVANPYYSDVSTEVVPCSGTKTFTKALYQNGTITIQVFNEEGNLIDNANENETVSAGDIVTLKGEIKGTYQRGLPWGGVLIAEYNATDTDDVILDFGGSKTSTPNIYVISETNRKTVAYTIPAILGNDVLTGKITLDMDDDNSGTSEWINLTLVPNNYFINEDTGGSYAGPSPEDEDSARTFGNTRNVFTIGLE